jgi:hypothetical protein
MITTWTTNKNFFKKNKGAKTSFFSLAKFHQKEK